MAPDAGGVSRIRHPRVEPIIDESIAYEREKEGLAERLVNATLAQLQHNS